MFLLTMYTCYTGQLYCDKNKENLDKFNRAFLPAVLPNDDDGTKYLIRQSICFKLCQTDATALR